MVRNNNLSTISPALRNKTKDELLIIIARKDAVEKKLRKENQRLKEVVNVLDSNIDVSTSRSNHNL